MEKLNNLKDWMKPRLQRLVRFINRLESRLERQALQRQRVRGKQALSGQVDALLGQNFPASPESSFNDRLGQYSPSLAVRTRLSGYRDRDEV